MTEPIVWLADKIERGAKYVMDGLGSILFDPPPDDTRRPDTMTDAPDYDAIEALRAKAEWGEWYVSTEGVGVNVYARAFEEGYGTHVADCTDDDPFDRKAIPNAELIVTAVNALPALIARCRELEAKVASIREVTINTLAADTDPVADGMALLRIHAILDSKD